MARKTVRKKTSKKTRRKSSKKGSRKSSKKSSRKSSAKSKKRSKSHSSKNDDSMVYLAILIVFGVLILAIGYRMYSTQEISESPLDVLVSVNEDQIIRSQLDFQYNLLPPEYKAVLSRDDVLERVIDETLLVQAARSEGLGPSEEELQAALQDTLQRNDVSLGEFELGLSEKNVTVDMFMDLLRRQAYIDAYTDEHINVEEPTDDELRTIYDLNKERYSTPEMAQVRHVLIGIQQENSAGVAKEVYDQAREGSDFCTLVIEFSQDVASASSCGEYTFARGQMVPEFEEAGFTMEVGEFQMVQTTFGYHIIEKLGMVEPGYLSFEEAKPSILSEYSSAEYARQYKVLAAELRDAAVITYGGEAPVVTGEVVVDAVVIDEEVTETVEVPEVEEPEESFEDNLFACINDRAILYGTSWNRDTRQAISLFADNGVELRYVYCDVSKAVCDSVGIEAYPTWVISGEKFLGRMSVADLAQATDCN